MKRIQQVFWELSSLRFFDSLVSDVRVLSSDGLFIMGVAGRGVHTALRSVLIVILYQLLYQSVQGYERPVHFRLRTVFHDTRAPVATTGDNSGGGIGRRLFVGDFREYCWEI